MSHEAQTDYCKLLDAHHDAASNGIPLLTEAGISYIQQALGVGDGVVPLPFWDGRRLCLGGRVLKEFSKRPAPYLTPLLDAFQKQGWSIKHLKDAAEILDVESEGNGRRRLHDAIKYLSSILPAGTIRFRGDGTGRGVYWTYATQSAVADDVEM